MHIWTQLGSLTSNVVGYAGYWAIALNSELGILALYIYKNEKGAENMYVKGKLEMHLVWGYFSTNIVIQAGQTCWFVVEKAIILI